MTRFEVIEIIKGIIEDNLDDVNVESIDPRKSMKDYGANSLDMIEVVSCSMRELSIKVPRAELAEIQNIDGLADKFMEYIEHNPKR